MQENTKSKVSVPIAIVVAGALIAGAVYLSNLQKPVIEQVKVGTEEVSGTIITELAIRPVSASDHVLGNPNAPIQMVVYTDTECPFCKNFDRTMQQVVDAYGKDGKVAWVYRHFPLEQLHTKAPKEAEATECAAELGGETAFWAYTKQLFAITPSNDGLDPAQLPKIAKDAGLDEKAFTDCWNSGKFTEKVRTDYNEAISAGGRGTPYTIFISKKPISPDTETMINNLAAQMPPETLSISKDKYRIAMSGALPYNIINQIITSLLK